MSVKEQKPIVILGGGVSGLAAAVTLLEAGHFVVVIEKAPQVGGAAATVPIPEKRRVPVGYHQIVGSDTHVIRWLKKLGIYEQVVWKKTSIATLVDGQPTNLASPIDMIRFPYLPLISRIRYMVLGARCLLTHDWQAWRHRNVSEFITKWSDQHVLKVVFKPLIDIKFGFSTDKADAAWLGSRLSHREGAVPFGYIPGTSWTEKMCQALEKKIKDHGGDILCDTEVTKITLDAEKKVREIRTATGHRFKPEIVISTLPPPVTVSLLTKAGAPRSWLKPLKPLKYISAYSLLAGVPKVLFPDYWTIFLHPRQTFGGCFTLSVLNETLVTSKDKAVINLFTNVPAGQRPWTTEEYQQLCQIELEKLLGYTVKFNWARTHYVPWVSPVFATDYENPPAQIGPNFYVAGIFRTYPKLSSTGEAMADGEAVAQQVLREYRF